MFLYLKKLFKKIFTSQKATVPIKFVKKKIVCPLCKSSKITALLPSNKHDYESGKQIICDDIFITLCENCGLVFENPQISVTELRDYGEKHYYNEIKNPLSEHDEHQKLFNKLRWEVLADRLPWTRIKKALDVGATGAWSAWIKDQYPEIESIVIEPSSQAIALCKNAYPQVKPVHGLFEEFEDEPNSYNLITFFYSLYTISKPLDALKKVSQLLSEDGLLLVCISHLRMEIEIWNNRLPWVNMAHLIRGVPLVYYSRRTLKQLLNAAGFSPVNEFIAQHPDSSDHWAGRQEHFIIAKKNNLSKNQQSFQSLFDPVERERSRDFFLKYCDSITDRSISEFFAQENVDKLIVVHDGDIFYWQWLAAKLTKYKCKFEEFVISSDQETLDLTDELDQPGWFILNATTRDIFTIIANRKWFHLQIINCCNFDDGPYGSWMLDAKGERIISRAFCPCKRGKHSIFPFNDLEQVNNLEILRTNF